MKILFLLDRFPQNGGVEQVTILIVNALSTRGFEIVILSKKGNRNILLNQLNPQIKYIGIDDCKFNVQSIHEVIEIEKIDLIINQGAYISTNKLLSILYQQYHYKIISFLHNEPDWLYKRAKQSIQSHDTKGYIKRALKPLYLTFIRKKINNIYETLLMLSDKVILLSDVYIQDFQKYIGDSSDMTKISSICNPVVTPFNVDLSNKEKSVIYVGRLDEKQKKLSRLFSIWGDVNSIVPNWRLQIVGDGPDLNYYKSLVENNGLKNVDFIGFKDNLNEIYTKASILVMTSDFEGFPMAIIEGMSYGCVPVIYESFSAAKKMINNNVNGYLIKPYDKERFKEVLIKLMKDKCLLTKNASYAIISSKNYSINEIIQQWIALFNG